MLLDTLSLLLMRYVGHKDSAVLGKSMKVVLIGLHQAHLFLIVRKRVLEDVMLAMDAPITRGLMTKGVEPKPAVTKQFLVIRVSILSFAKKVLS